MAEKRSPLRDKPLRNPGQSMEERLFDITYNKILSPIFLAMFLLIMAGLEWLRDYWKIPYSPLLYSAVAIVATAYAAFRIIRAFPELRALRLARDGERAVGQYLERLREVGFQVFHDVVGSGFNIDHVLVGPAGIFTIETKTFSKRPAPNAKVHFDGREVVVDGSKPERDPIVQSKAQARWLRELLAESTGRSLAVRPVLLFPGWYVEQAKGTNRDVWVLNPKALPKFLENEVNVLSPEDIKLASYHLSRFIRTGLD